MASLLSFYDRIGTEDPPLVAPVIEAYCSSGLSGLTPATRGTYRSVLRALSPDERPRPAPGFPGSRARPPYSASERAELFSVASAQARSWRRRSALALICLGLGAGLRAGEIVEVLGDDVTCDASRVTVRVRGRRARVVPVDGEPAAVLASFPTGPSHLFHDGDADRSYPNFVNDFCRRLVSDPASPGLSVARLRSSYVCDHLASGTPVSRVLELTGIDEVESLSYYAVHLEGFPTSKAGLRRLQAAQSR